MADGTGTFRTAHLSEMDSEHYKLAQPQVNRLVSLRAYRS